MIEPRVDDEISLDRIGCRPEISYCIAFGQRLRKMPELARDCEFAHRMGDGKSLTELGTPERTLCLLGGDSVGVDVKPCYIGADKKKGALAEAADIDIGSAAVVEAVNVTDGYCGATTLAGKDNGLDSRGTSASPGVGAPWVRGARQWLAKQQQLKPRGEGEFGDLVDAPLV